MGLGEFSLSDTTMMLTFYMLALHLDAEETKARGVTSAESPSKHLHTLCWGRQRQFLDLLMPALVAIEFVDEDLPPHGHAHTRGGALANDARREHGAASWLFNLDHVGVAIQAGDRQEAQMAPFACGKRAMFITNGL